jgi:kinesin family protein 11
VALQYRDTCVKAQFAQVFGPSVTQAEFFEYLVPNIELLFEGKSCSILAYGNTGSGKTYTIYGGDWTALDKADGPHSDQGISLDTRGLVLRIPKSVFHLIDSAEEGVYLSVRYFQIYNEKVIDMIIVAAR